jgi:hypothetical protein
MRRLGHSMNVCIAGSRSFNNFHLLKQHMDKIHDVFGIVNVISGTAKGADKLGEEWAEWHGLNIIRYPADWDKHGNVAGILRNIEMAKSSDLVVLFWDGKSPGTKQMLEYCLKNNIFVKVIKYAS